MVNTRNSKRKSSSVMSSDATTINTSAKRRSHRDVSDDETLGSDHPRAVVVITPRENDFNEKTWWMVDLDPIDETSLQGATALVKRCMRMHGWDEAKARKVLASYRQFIFLKKELKDWDTEILSPCHLVDQMWHCHILDVVNYCHDMMLLCGHVVGHNPDGALDSAAKQKRDDTTRKALVQHFGSYDEEIWNYFPNDAATGNNVNSNANQSAGTPPLSEPPSSHDAKDSIVICLKHGREEVLMRVNRTTQMMNVFRVFATRKGIDVHSFRFMIDGEMIDPTSTPAALDLKDSDKIDCFLGQGGC
jgi:hypothetical protein